MLLSASPITLNYGYDSDILFNGGIVYTFDNLDFSNSSLLASSRDITLNNDQLLVLTDCIKLSDAITHNIPPLLKTFVYNTLITNNEGNYLYATAPSSLTGGPLSFTSNILSATVFNLYFPTLSANNIQIYYTIIDANNNNINLYVNCAASPISAGSVSPLTEADYNFFYLLSGDSMSLIATNNGNYGKFVSNDGATLTCSTLTPVAPNEINITSNCIYKVLRLHTDNTNNEIQNYGQSDLVKYTPRSKDLSITNSTGNVQFNYLITAAFKNTSASNIEGVDLNANILPLKNYYDPRHLQSAILNQQQRSYTKIYTGLNESDGTDKIYVGYNSSSFKIDLKEDTNTYFHYPYFSSTSNIVPGDSTPLSSTSLVSYGAYAGPVPLRSDRIFKKAADYRKYSHWGTTNANWIPGTGSGSDVYNGAYLCSWLSAGANSNIVPVWMDRFYDPKYVNIKDISSTTIYALSGVLAYSTNNYSNLIWDAPSSMVMEPGCLYYYFRVGDNTNNSFVLGLSGLTYYFNEWGPSLFNQVTSLSAGVITSFTDSNSGIDDTVRTPYYNTNNTYGIINTSKADFDNNKGNTLSFYSYQDDWTNIKGDQIIGNYFNGGIGVFNNNDVITPYFTVTAITQYLAGTVRTLNSDLNTLNYESHNTLQSSSAVSLSGHNFVVRGEYDGSYYVVDNALSNKFLSNYDPDDLITSKIPLSSFSSTIGSRTIVDVILHSDSVQKYIIAKTRPTASSCEYYKFLTNGVLVSSTSSSTWNNFAVNIEGNPIFYNSPWITANQLSCVNNCTDSAGAVFVLSACGVNTTAVVKSHSLLNQGSALLSVTKPEYINCDQDDNIWIVYNDTSLAKINNIGTVLWTKQINTSETIVNYSSIRTISFIAELTPTGNVYYALILDGKTEYIYKVDQDGNVVEKIYVKGLVPNGDVTGFNYQRRYIKPNISLPGLSVKMVVTDSTLDTPNPVYITLNSSASALSPGWHHFAVTYDETNIAKFYIDGEIVSQSTTTYPTGDFLYRVYNYKNNPQLTLGTSNFKNTTLNQWIKQNSTYIYSGKLADVRLYNLTLPQPDIKALSKNYLYNQFNDFTWSFQRSPTANRAYIEEIDRLFLHRMPGSKSAFYDIKIKNSSILDPKVRAIVENNIRTAAINIAPAYTKLRSIVWE